MFTLFCGQRAFVEEAARQRKLEGYLAEAAAGHFWFHDSLGSCAVTLVPEGRSSA